MTSQPANYQSASIYVGDLHPEVTEGVLFELFNRVGPVVSIRVCRDTITKRSLGYAYVNFQFVHDAERAIDTMNFNDIRGRPCRIMWSQRDPSVRKSGVGNIFIKNLPPTLDHKNLFDLFSVFGNILSCKVAMDENGVSKGYGYIHYETAEAAQDAITKFNGNSIDDYTVEVVSFLRRNERSGQSQWNNTYVKQFPKSWDENKLKELVSPFGEVSSIAIMKDNDGVSKGFGFISFTDHEAASKAVEALSKHVIEEGGQTFNFYIGRAQKKSDRHRELSSQFAQKRDEKLNLFAGRNLYVKNIDDEVTDEELNKIFSEHGAVANAKIMRDPVTGASKGFGFVCYNMIEDAQKAISALNSTRIRSKPLVVTLHQRKDVRRAHLQQSTPERWRPFPQNGPNMGAPMPFMMVHGAQGGPFPGQRPFYNGEYPRGAPNPRGPPARGGFYPVPPYGVQPGQQPGQQPQQQQQQQQQINRFPNGQPMPQQVPVQGIQGAPRGPMPARGPYAGAPRGPPQANGPVARYPNTQVPYPGRGPVPIKFTNQVRNPPMGMPGMPQHGVDMGLGLSPMTTIEPLDSKILASAAPQDQKNMIGERLYPMVQTYEMQRAGKITGMLLEMETSELLNLIESPEALQSKVREALMVLQQHEQSMQQ